MTHYRAYLSERLRVLVAILGVVITFGSCTDLDPEVGDNLLPNAHEMRLGERLFADQAIEGVDATPIFDTRLYITDSIRSSSVSYGYYGRERDKVFGARKSGFFTQYLPGYELDPSDGFGYMPIYDSMMLYFTHGSYTGDTTLVQKFNVYEVVDDAFIANSKDSVFFSKFDMSSWIGSEPIFEFSFPDQANGIYTNTERLRLVDLPAARDFIAKLMGADVKNYDSDNYALFLKSFKGLYIMPVEPLGTLPAPADELNPSGAIYSMALEGSGFGFYGRNRSKVDPTIIQDTIGMTYFFLNKNLADKEGSVSINTIEHDYTLGEIDMNSVGTPLSEGELTTTLRVAGMAGVVSEITLREEFFAAMDEVLSEALDSSGGAYNSIFFNQAKLNIYMPQGDYDPQSIQPLVITPWLNVMPSRLALYERYADYQFDEDGDGVLDQMLEGIADYPYFYETAYGTSLSFGGYLNRSLGCYEMNIEAQMQAVWNSYLEAKEAAGGDISGVDWSKVEGRTFYLAPISTSLFSSKYATLQGMQGGGNNAPMRLKLTYTLIK